MPLLLLLVVAVAVPEVSAHVTETGPRESYPPVLEVANVELVASVVLAILGQRLVLSEPAALVPVVLENSEVTVAMVVIVVSPSCRLAAAVFGPSCRPRCLRLRQRSWRCRQRPAPDSPV